MDRKKVLLAVAIVSLVVYTVLRGLEHFDVVTGFEAFYFAAFGTCWLALSILEQQHKVLKITHAILAGLGFLSSIPCIFGG